MENQSVAQKLEALVKLQTIDSKNWRTEKLRRPARWGAGPEDELEGYRTCIGPLGGRAERNWRGNQENKEGNKEAEKLIKKYTEQQQKRKNNREYDAITKRDWTARIRNPGGSARKRLKKPKRKIEAEEGWDWRHRKSNQRTHCRLRQQAQRVDEIAAESQEEEKKLLGEREKATKKIGRQNAEALRAFTRKPEQRSCGGARSAWRGLRVVTLSFRHKNCRDTREEEDCDWWTLWPDSCRCRCGFNGRRSQTKKRLHQRKTQKVACKLQHKGRPDGLFFFGDCKC